MNEYKVAAHHVYLEGGQVGPKPQRHTPQFAYRFVTTANGPPLWVDLSFVIKVDLRVSAFVTHGSLNSVLEAVHSGTPMVTVPVFGDQFRSLEVDCEGS